MRVAALYDIHGNLPALRAVLREVGGLGVGRIVVGGDIVPGPIVLDTLRRLLDLDVPVDFIHGNGESAVLACRAGNSLDQLPEQAQEAVRWTASRLTSEHEDLLASWPGTRRLEVPPLGEVLFCHATPRSDTEIFTRATPDARLRPLFEPLDVPLVVCGHTHMQFDRRIGETRVVNAGSVGMPFGTPGADWALLGPDVELRHTEYDLDAAAGRIRATDYPQAERFANGSILHPPSKEEMLKRFSQTELRE